MGCNDEFGRCRHEFEHGRRHEFESGRRHEFEHGRGREFHREHRPDHFCEDGRPCRGRRMFFEDETSEDRRIIIPIFPRRFR